MIFLSEVFNCWINWKTFTIVEVDTITAQIEELKAKLEVAKAAAGINNTKTTVYYKVKL